MRNRWAWFFLSIAGIAAVACLAVLLRNGSGTAADSTAPTTTVPPSRVPVVANGPAIPDDVSPSVPATTPPRAITEADQATLASFGASIKTGPKVATEGDPDTTELPTAQDLGILAKLPVDWGVAMATAARATNALGTPNAAEGQYLATAVSGELYQAWVASLDNPTLAGTFTVTQFALADVPSDRTAPLTFVGTGTFTSAQPPTVFVISTTVSPSPSGWRVTAAEFNRFDGGL